VRVAELIRQLYFFITYQQIKIKYKNIFIACEENNLLKKFSSREKY